MMLLFTVFGFAQECKGVITGHVTDAQVSAGIPYARGLRAIVSMLDLNNEVFGFYQGSEQYPIQREYYSPAYFFGLRWTTSPEGEIRATPTKMKNKAAQN